MSSPSGQTPRPAVRPFYWSVRRELWENRSVYVAPLIAAAVVMFGVFISTVRTQHSAHALVLMGSGKATGRPDLIYSVAATAIVVTAFVVAVFYCLGALHNERRDRSILFWKSLPVSDLTAVLAKATVPLVVLPAIAFAVVVVLQLAMLLLAIAGLMAHGLSVGAMLWQLPMARLWLVLVYGLVSQTLWYAPVYGWLMLVSGWAKRAPFLWAVLPPLALSLLEKIAFDTSHLASLLKYRLAGGYAEAFVILPRGALGAGGPSIPDPARFLASPGLWLGLIAAAGFLAAAVWVRRHREPI